VIRITDSRLSSLRPVLIKYQVTIDERIENNISEVNDIMLICTKLSIEVMPRTNVRLVIQLPSTLPRPTSYNFFLNAWIVVVNSGSEVPKAMMVAPITEGARPNNSAMLILLLTSSLDEITTKNIETRNLSETRILSFLYITVMSSIPTIFAGVFTVKNTNNEIRTKPSNKLTLPVWSMNKGISDEIKRNLVRLSKTLRLKINFLFLLIITAKPSTIVMLATFEPRMLPRARLPSPRDAALIDTNSSGSEVESERRMKPADISLIPMTFDNFIT